MSIAHSSYNPNAPGSFVNPKASYTNSNGVASKLNASKILQGEQLEKTFHAAVDLIKNLPKNGKNGKCCPISYNRLKTTPLTQIASFQAPFSRPMSFYWSSTRATSKPHSASAILRDRPCSKWSRGPNGTRGTRCDTWAATRPWTHT